MTEYEKMLADEFYKTSDTELCDARLLTEQYNKTSVLQSAERAALLKQLFGTIGEEILIVPTFNCDYGRNIHVGTNFSPTITASFLMSPK